VSVRYEAEINATGFNITWELTGNVPPWLGAPGSGSSPYSNYYYIGGTPQTTGTWTFTVKATNDISYVTKQFTIVVNALTAPTITWPSSLSNGELGVERSWEIEANKNAEWSVTPGGALPPGLEFHKGYQGSRYTYIIGTPTQAGTFNFTVAATNSAGSGTKSFSITVTALQPPTITTTSLPNGEAGTSYDRSIYTSGSNVTWSLTGNVPPGLYINEYGWNNWSEGGGGTSIYGTPTTPGTYNVTVTATNDAGSVTKPFTIVIAQQTKPAIYAWDYQHNGEVGTYGSWSIDANKSVSEWRLAAGAPPWLQIESWGDNYAHVYGTPTASGNITFTVEAENGAGTATRQFTINVLPAQPPSIYTWSAPESGEVGTDGWWHISANKSVTTWSLVNAPSWLQISFMEGGSSYASVYGTPTTSGNITFTVKADNGAGLVDTKQFTIAVAAQQPPSIYAWSDPRVGEVGVWDYWNINADKYVSTWSLVNAPPWLEIGSLDGSTTYVYGEPATSGNVTFTVRAENSAGQASTQQFTIVVAPPTPPTIYAWDSPRSGQVGESNSWWISANKNVTWSVVGSLPPGLYLDEWYNGNNYAYIEGTPTQEGTHTFTIKAVNSAGQETTQQFTIVVAPPPAPEITGEYINNGDVGGEWEGYVYANIGGVTWSIVNNEPSWLQIDQNYQGNDFVRIYGIPTHSGQFTVTVKATNGSGDDTKELTVVVAVPPAPQIVYENVPPDGQAGGYFGGELYASYYSRGVIWEIVNGPQWLTIKESHPGGYSSDLGYNQDAYVRFGGTPPTADEYTFTVRATNETDSDERSFTVNIGELTAPEIWGSSIPDGGQEGGYYESGVQAQGYGITWDVVSGALPDGLRLEQDPDQGNGYSYVRILGTPTAAAVGPHTFTLKADNGVAGNNNTREFTINIIALQPPVITTEAGPLLRGERNKDYSTSIRAEGNNIEWSVIGSLPTGISFDRVEVNQWEGASYKYIEGYPTTVGTYPFKVVAKNAAGSDTTAYTITVTEPQIPVITTATLPYGALDTYYNNEIRAESYGYTTWSLTGNVPPGLQIYNAYNWGSGYADTRIYGTPTQTGTYTFSIVATNNVGSSVAATYTIKIVTLEIVTASLPAGEINKPYEARIEVYGKDISGFSALWETVGELPQGLSYYAGGGGPGYSYRIISGTPDAAGIYPFTVRVGNYAGDVDEKELSIEIYVPHTVTFNLNYTGAPAPTTGKTGAGGKLVTQLPTPARDIYDLTGWYTAASGGDRVVQDRPYSGDTDVFAQWTLKKYEVKFVDHNGAVLSSQTVTHGSAASAPGNPSREGYNFSSWDKAFTNVTGVLTVTAQYTPKQYAVTFSATDANGVLEAKVGGSPITTGAQVEHDRSVSFNAIPAKGYKVSGWTLNGAPVNGTAATYTLTVSGAATVAVSFGVSDAVLTPDRVVPDAKPGEEATVIAPVSQLSGEFTAGPNPVAKSAGVVNFFRQGKRVSSGELRIYDATGNVVGKVQISDKALNTQARRQVGSWDLTDRNGRTVSEGTYLVKGVLKTSDGKKEKVSVIVGVR